MPLENPPENPKSGAAHPAEPLACTGPQDTGGEEPAALGPEIDAAPARAPMRRPMRGLVVTVEPLSAVVHGDQLYAASHGADRERLWRYLPERPFPSRESFLDYLAARERSEDPLFFAIVENRSRRAVGMAAFLRFNLADRSVEVGHILYSAALQRTRGATEAMYLMARNAFEEMGNRRYEWKCDALNQPSRQAALRLGFRFEGVFRQHRIVKGRNRDTAWYSMLDSEWPERRAAFELWLRESNFDSNGKQKQSLAALNRSAAVSAAAALPVTTNANGT